MFTLADVDAYAKTLAGVTVGTSWGHRTWAIGKKGFVWERPLSKADIKRLGNAPLPQGELLGVRVENLDAKDALLAIAPAGFFTIEHFNGYPAVLIELRLARAADVRRAILDAWRAVAPPVKTKAVTPTKKPAQKPTKKPAQKPTKKLAKKPTKRPSRAK